MEVVLRPLPSGREVMNDPSWFVSHRPERTIVSHSFGIRRDREEKRGKNSPAEEVHMYVF
jgi:hypothetical protein